MTARQTSTHISSVDVLPLDPSGWSLWSIWCQKKDANDKAASCSSDAAGFLLHSLTAACCVCECLVFFSCTDGLHRVFPARCNDIQIGRVICQVHFALGLTPGRSMHCVSRGKKKKKALHVACIYRAISSRLQRVED